MKLKLVSFNGHAINDGTAFVAKLAGDLPWTAETGIIKVGRWPFEDKFTGKKLSGITLPVTIQMLGVLADQIETLGAWMDETDQNQYELLGEDLNDSNKQYYVMATVTKITGTAGSIIRVVSFYIQNPVWLSKTLNSSTLAVVASGNSIAPVAGGCRPTRPILTVTPTTAAASDYSYKRFVIIRNPTASKLTKYPLDVTGGGINTAALVSAGKMLASGNDWRLIIDSTEVARWLGNMNANPSTMWTNIDFSPAITFILSAVVASSGTADIAIKKTTAAIAAIKLLPAGSIIQIGNELIQIGVPNVTAMKLPVVTRGAKGTTAAAHSIGDSAYWIEHDIWMMYGNAAAEAPDQTDAEKPLIDLDTSTNTSWVYSAFTEATGLRAGAWAASVITTTGKESEIYTATQDANADPATAMGMSIKAYLKSNRWQAEKAEIQWLFSNPMGITSVSLAGNKYSITTTWPSVASLQSAIKDSWTTKWTETIPATLSSWTAWTHANQAITTTHQNVRLVLKGTQPASDSAQASFEATSATVVLTQGPAITLFAEASNYPMACTISNSTTGESISLVLPMILNKSVIIDTEARTVVFDGQNVRNALTLSSIRVEWLKFVVGANTIVFTQTGTGYVTLKIEWRDRNVL